MPPRTAKRGSTAAGTKRTPRATRAAAQKVHAQPEVSEVKPKPEESAPVQVVDLEEAFEEAVEEKPVVNDVIESEPELEPEREPVPEPRVEETSAPEPVSLGSLKKEDEVKQSGDEYEKDECLDLDDNEPEYEPEEYGGVDYDEKEIEQDGDEDEVDEDPEEEEENIGEEEADMGDEEEDNPEEVEGEEGDEHAGEEANHADEKEHHDVVKERRKRKEFEVFVGGLDKDATENDLRKVFGEVGEITEVRLMMNPQTKKNKGFAFLRFATVEQARKAVTDLKNPVVNGRQCGVSQSHDSDTVFLGNICKTWTKEALKEKLKYFGIDTVEDLTLVEDSNNDGMNRGFAFLEFSSRADAMDAYKRLQKRDVTFGVDRPAKVSFADSFIDPGDEIMAQVKTVFVDGLPSSWDEDRVRDIVKKYGEVVKVELARNMPSAKRKDFGFVTFQTHDAAVTCAKSINNTELGEGDHKVKVRARLSRPLQRPRGKYSTRGDSRAGTAGRGVRGSWGRPPPLRSSGGRGSRGMGSRLPPLPVKRQSGFRDRRPVMAIPSRDRHLPPPSRSYDRRAPVPSYPKSSSKRDYARREELPPRSRAHVEYGSRVAQERRPSYQDEYSTRVSGYPDLPRSAPRTTTRRAYVDDGYDQRFERPPPTYREGRARDYEPISGSKRPYTALDDVPPRYVDASIRRSRPRLDYELGAASSQYGDTYSDRVGRSNAGYTSGRTPISSHESPGVYSIRQSSSYGGGSSYGRSEVSGMYSSSYSGDYISRGTDVGGSSYSSIYPSRGGGGSSYMGSRGGSGSYY